MSESNKALLDWFGKRKESSVTEDARGHALSICDCASDLRNVLDCMARGDPEGARKGIERLILAEDESVRVSERLCVRISRAAGPGNGRRGAAGGLEGDLRHGVRARRGG